ncbi:MAG TPA: GDSL-type esterase/lipase family protein [bacterium]|nr:GDSL-type esterase/lipase family protein [bacterium]HQI47030.1 GDSL-type esterase/lipase family protein [bacterium]HQJ65731.1 GDSL-type esterase/lipase family protein [bacterium]
MNMRLSSGIVMLTLLVAAVLGQDRTIRVACIGNSITIGSGGSTAWPQQLGQRLGAHYSVRNFGVSGTTMLKHGDFPYWNESAFLQAQDFDPHIVIITLGTNDSKPQNRVFLGEMFADYMDFIKILRKNGRDPQIYVARPCPVFGDGGGSGINGSVLHGQIEPIIDSVRTAAGGFMIDWYRAMLSHADLFPDGIHPNTIGYAMMADTAAWYLKNSPSGFIRLFAATDTEVEVGEMAMLYWEATPGSQVTLNGTPVQEIDSLKVEQETRTVYTLAAAGAVADTKRVVIDNIPPGRIKSLNAFPLQLDEGAGDTSIISWLTTNGSTVTLDGAPVTQNGSLAVVPAQTTTYTLAAGGGENHSAQITIEVLPSVVINRALRHPLTASSTLRGGNASWAVDGDTTTAWQSAGKITEWIMVDFGRTITLNTLRIHWGNGYAVSYALQFYSSEGTAIKAITQRNGDGGLDEVTNINTQARYLRLLCQKVNGVNYSVKELEAYGTTMPAGVSRHQALPIQFELEQNYPNPFNPVTSIAYTLAHRTQVSLMLFDVNGRQVRVLDSGLRAEGRHEILLNGAGLSSGVYFYTLSGAGASQTRQMLLIK